MADLDVRLPAPQQDASGVVFSFPDLSPDRTARFVDAFKARLLQKGAGAAAQFRVARSNDEAMVLGRVMAFLGMAFLEANAKRAAEAVYPRPRAGELRWTR